MTDRDACEWSPDAGVELEQYLARVAELCRSRGDDAADITENLREHVMHESQSAAGRVVTAEHVRKVLGALGTAEQVVGAESATTTPKDDRPPTLPVSDKPRSWRYRFNDAMSSKKAVFFWLFAIVIPLITIAYESSSKQLASFYIDPIPSLYHLVLLLMAPVGFATTDIVMRVRIGLDKPLGLIGKLVFVLNGLAVGISLIYLVVMVPILPIAVLLILVCGLGILGLTPVWCTLGGLFQMRKLHQWGGLTGMSTARCMGMTLIGLLLAFCLLVFPEARGVAIDYSVASALSDDRDEQVEGLEMLRWLGAEDDVLERCYSPNAKSSLLAWTDDLAAYGFFNLDDGVGRTFNSDAERYRTLYYRLTGRSFNSVDHPRRLQSRRGRGGWSDFESWDEQWISDEEIGGQAVGGRVLGLTLHSSVMNANLSGDADGSAGPGLAQLEWTLEFKNASSVVQEARAQIQLPSGAVASRLTLWINGEEREAAFGGRNQVRKAYEEVAVRQRRDPALLSWSGLDRLLLQCFPVPAGGSMKVKVGITIPMKMTARKAYLRLPRFSERNFRIPNDLRHELWAESPSQIDFTASGLTKAKSDKGICVIRGKLTEADLQTSLTGSLSMKARDGEMQYYAGKLGEQVGWMSVGPAGGTQPKRVCLVIDGSAQMEDVMANIDWEDFFRELPGEIEVRAIFAGEKVVEWSRPGRTIAVTSLMGWIADRDYVGGCDPVAALERAWDFCAGDGGGVILWIHGPVPVKMASVEALRMRFSRRPANKSGSARILSLQVRSGPNTVADDLADIEGVRRIEPTGSLQDTINHAATVITGREIVHKFALDSPAPGEVSAGGGFLPVREHVIRLAVSQLANSAWRSRDSSALAPARAKAVKTCIVTPLSGAVVLETKEQYNRHSLEPAKAEDVPGVPEPTTLLLLCAAAPLLLRRRRKRIASGT